MSNVAAVAQRGEAILTLTAAEVQASENRFCMVNCTK